MIQANGQAINPGIVITFDDFAIENWYRLQPILEKYDAKATFYICNPFLLDTNHHQQIIALNNAGNEIGCHGFNHFDAVNFTDTASIEAYMNKEILPSIQWFDSVLNIKLNCFAYPYGARNSNVDRALYNYFNTIRGTVYNFSNSLSKITNLSSSRLIHGIGIDKTYNHSIDDLKYELDRCKTDSMIQVFYAHTPVDSITGKYQITYSFIDSLLNYAYETGLNFYTADQLFMTIPDQPLGDTIISQNTAQSIYSALRSGNQLEWQIKPDNAGELITYDSVAELIWNQDEFETCELRVAYKNDCGIGKYSKPLIINKEKKDEVVQNYTKPVALNVYPNPANNAFNVSVNKLHKNLTISISDTYGRLIENSPITAQLNTYYLNKGMYLVTLTNGKTKVTKILLIK